MKISIRKAVATAAVGALAATGAASMAPMTATAAEETAAAPVLTPFGYNTVAAGARVTLQGVDVRQARLAQVSQSCTRLAGLAKANQLVPTTPVSDYIDIKGISSTSKTYKVGSKYGAIATNKIGDIGIGSIPGTDAVAGLGLITLEGLTTTADAFHTPQGFGSKSTLKAVDINITLPDALEDIPVPVQDLLDAVDQTVTPVVEEVVKVLQENLGVIEIPGFGKIALGETVNKKGAHFASADARGLVISFTGDGSKSRIYLGEAHSRIGGLTPARVFRSNIQAMDLKVLDGAVHLNRVAAANLPCEGTYGVTKSKKLDVAGVVAPVVVDLAGINNTYSGTQNKFKAAGWAQSSIGQVSIPLYDVTLKNIVTRVSVSKIGSQRVVSNVKTSLGELIIGGKSVAIPAPGDPVEILDATGLLVGTVEVRAVKKGKFGATAQAVRVTLFNENVELLLGWADNNIWSQ